MMEQQFKIMISSRTIHKEFELPDYKKQVKIGTTSACEFRLNPDLFFDSISLEIQKKDSVREISCSDNLFLKKDELRKFTVSEISHGDAFSVCYADSGIEVFKLKFMIDFDTMVLDFSWGLDLSGRNELTIGGDSRCDLVIDSPFTQNSTAVLTRRGNSFVLKELQSPYGIAVNGKKILQPELLWDMDFFSISDFSFYYKRQHLYFDRNRITDHTREIFRITPESSFRYPLFIRNTRVKYQSDTSPIPVLNPSPKPAPPKVNVVTTLMPTLAMFALVVVLRGFMSSSGGTYVIFSICSMGLGAFTSVMNLIYGKKDYKKTIAEREETYKAYIGRKEQEILSARREELACLNNTCGSVEQDIINIREFRPGLFDRTPQDEDFLDVCIGTGRVEAKRLLDYKKQEQLETGDELVSIPAGLSENYKYIDGAPVTVRLRDANAVGVVGTTDDLYEFFKLMITDVCSRQYYGDVQVFTLLDNQQKKYDWIRLLPHLKNAEGGRNIVCDDESKNRVFETLYKDLDQRNEDKKQPHIFNVIFVLDEKGIKKHPISKFIENAAELDTVFIFFEQQEEYLPLYCSRIIKIQNQKGIVFESADVVRKNEFSYRLMNDSVIKDAVRILSPIYCEEISLESSLRKSISLFELLGIYTAEDLDLSERWTRSKVYDSIAVPIGVNAKNEIVYLDPHEKAHGPHGLVAGTTGSGKSEILQTFILGAATLFPPSETGFLIIDFKGGGMANQFKNLPHLLGTITNIDGKSIQRSLKSIRAELEKRQNLFLEAGVNHIDKYIKAYKEGKARSPLPHLFIIVDEFAELKQKYPDFMSELISTARIGRSLGVHLILATQKPSGQVNEQIWSNSRFKLCLKVQTQEDSNEVLKSPLAAEIREPGRAYLQVGNNEIFELLQSGFSGAPEKSDDNKLKPIRISSLDFKGNRTLLYEQKGKKSEKSRNQLEATVDYISRYCSANHIEKLPEICLPILPDTVVFDPAGYNFEKDASLSCPIGIYDNPERQYQGPAFLHPGEQNTIIIGSAQFGKTNMLEQMIRYLAEHYTPSELNLYIIDFGSMILKNFESLHHVGGVVLPSDDEKVKNLFAYLADQVAERHKRLLEAGVSSFVSYKEAGYTDLPNIVVFIDNLILLRESYFSEDDLLLPLCREGISVGITFVAANSQTIGIGFRYLSNFASRFSLFCNDSTEYSNLFGFTKMKPDEKPGRGLIEIEKDIYECQSFLAFKGDKEIDRIRAMQRFISDTNDKNKGLRATRIPEIPDDMTEDYIFEEYPDTAGEEERFIVGLDYEKIAPAAIDLRKNSAAGISGGEETGQSDFIRYFVHAVNRSPVASKIYIFDDYRKKLQPVSAGRQNIEYAFTGDGLKECIMGIEQRAADRFLAMTENREYAGIREILIINSTMAAEEISKDKEAMNALRNLTGKYKEMDVFLLVGNMPDAPVPYGAPELYKLLKENKVLLYMDNIEKCKILDVPYASLKKFKKKISPGDAYYFLDNECVRVRIPYAKRERTQEGGS